MKNLKSFLSRALIVLSIAVQITILYLLFSTYKAYFVWERIISAVIALIIVLKLLTKKVAPEFKIPWLVLFAFFPVLGFCLYLLFGSTKVSKSKQKFFREVKNEYQKIITETKHAKLEKQKFLGKYKGIEQYLFNTLKTKGFLNSKVEYFSLGEDYFSDLLLEIDRAKQFIFIETFIIKSGYMWDTLHSKLLEKVRNGVEVRLIYDDIGTLGKLVSGYYKTLNKQGINCQIFNPVKPLVSGIYNNRDHRKMVIIDGEIAYTGGVNIADEYINKTSPFGHWKDCAVKIKGEAVNNLTCDFLSTFDLSSKQCSVYKNYAKLNNKPDKIQGYVHPFSCGPMGLYSTDVARQNLINMISVAEKSVYITTPYLIIDTALTSAITSSALKGVDVRIILPKIPDKKIIYGVSKSTAQYLREKGVKIYFYSKGFIHSKTVLIDGEFAFVGTINLDYRSLSHHFENGVVTYKTTAVKDVKKDFENVFSVSEIATEKNCKVNKFTRLINAFLAAFRPLL